MLIAKLCSSLTCPWQPQRLTNVVRVSSEGVLFPRFRIFCNRCLCRSFCEFFVVNNFSSVNQIINQTSLIKYFKRLFWAAESHMAVSFSQFLRKATINTPDCDEWSVRVEQWIVAGLLGSVQAHLSWSHSRQIQCVLALVRAAAPLILSARRVLLLLMRFCLSVCQSHALATSTGFKIWTLYRSVQYSHRPEVFVAKIHGGGLRVHSKCGRQMGYPPVEC